MPRTRAWTPTQTIIKDVFLEAPALPQHSFACLGIESVPWQPFPSVSTYVAQSWWLWPSLGLVLIISMDSCNKYDCEDPCSAICKTATERIQPSQNVPSCRKHIWYYGCCLWDASCEPIVPWWCGDIGKSFHQGSLQSQKVMCSQRINGFATCYLFVNHQTVAKLTRCTTA